MLKTLAAEMQHLIKAMQINFLFTLKLVGVLWLIHMINWMTQYHFNELGIRPRTLRGIPGIIFTPFLHGDFNHLFFNTLPLIVLAELILPGGRVVFYYITGSVILLSGSLIWLIGQNGVHIGASSLIMGYFGYILSKTYFHLTATTVLLAGFCLYYFGGLLLSIFPSAKKNVSWDGHLYGLLSGIFTAYYLPNILRFVGV